MRRTRLLLESYHQLKLSDSIEVRHLLMDLDRAIRNAELTDFERCIIQSLYLDEPEAPIHNGKKGRPKGGPTVRELAKWVTGLPEPRRGRRKHTVLGSTENLLYRLRKRAIIEIETQLGEGYASKIPEKV